MAHQFDPQQFMNSTYSEANATKTILIPAGEYPAIIEKIESGISDKGNAWMRVVWNIDDQGVKDAIKRDKATCRQFINLDIDDSGNLQFGEGVNVGLGRLRTAVGQNTGAAWSPMMLVNAAAKVKVSHSPRKDDPEQVDANVVAVTALG